MCEIFWQKGQKWSEQWIVHRWKSDIWSNTWSCFLIHVYRRYMYASVQDKCFFVLKKITCVYTYFNYTHIHIETHTLLEMLACTDLFWSVNRHGYFIILINTMDCSFLCVLWKSLNRAVILSPFFIIKHSRNWKNWIDVHQDDTEW